MLINNKINYDLTYQRKANQDRFALYPFFQQADTVSFSASQKIKKTKIPYRLQAKMQDDFHITSRQIGIRNFLEKKGQGLTPEEIAKLTFPKTFNNGTEEDKAEVLSYMQNMQKEIDNIDESFRNVIPLLFPKTFYRGIADNSTNRAIEVIKEAKVGDVIMPDLGYPFMASDLKYAEGYSQYTDGSSNPETCIVMIIKAPIGTPVSRDISFNMFSGDSNTVLARGANFKVLDKEIKNNKTYITLEYLNCALDRE